MSKLILYVLISINNRLVHALWNFGCLFVCVVKLYTLFPEKNVTFSKYGCSILKSMNSSQDVCVCAFVERVERLSRTACRLHEQSLGVVGKLSDTVRARACVSGGTREQSNELITKLSLALFAFMNNNHSSPRVITRTLLLFTSVYVRAGFYFKVEIS